MTDRDLTCAGCGEPIDPRGPRILSYPGQFKGAPAPEEPGLAWHNFQCVDIWHRKTEQHAHP
jgi:hypothetical protein